MADIKMTKDGINSLPDTAILRLIEVAMEEMLLFEAKNKRHAEIFVNHPLSEGRILKVQLKNFLLT